MCLNLMKSFSVLFLINFVSIVNCLYLDLNDGDQCAWGDVSGTCVDLRRCKTYITDLDYGRSPPICSYNGGMPIICCTSCEIYNITYGIEEYNSISEIRNRLLGLTGVKHYDMETFGCWGVAAKKLVKDIGRRIFDNGGDARSGWFLEQRLSIAIQRGNAACLMGTFAPGTIRECIQNFRKFFECSPEIPYQGSKTTFVPELGCHIFELTYSGRGAVGGKDAERSEFPHMALLGYGEDLESAQWLCGGSVISERFILTAAHCKSESILGPVNYVGLGMLKRSDPVSLWDRYRVKRFIQHPGYRSPSKYNDIALIETDREIKFHKSVLPACIAGDEDIQVQNYLVNSEDTVSATGWGALGHRKQTANVLQKVELQRFEELECAAQYPPSRNLRDGYDHSTQMCYGDRVKPRDTCGGDSGGPLQVRSEHAHCLFIVLGVTSYGGPCGFVGSAGIYTRVRDYVPWIEDIVWRDDTLIN